MSVFGITFGIELEFICVFPTDFFDTQLAHLQYSDDILEAGPTIQHYLLRHDVPATGKEDPEHALNELGAPPFTRWFVQNDHLYLSKMEEAVLPRTHQYDRIELSSPKFHLCKYDEFTAQLTRLLEALEAMERETGCYFLTNSSCGFHVHIGNDKGEPMPFDVVKRITQLFLAHERNFDTIHAASRITNPICPKQFESTPLFAPLSFFMRTSDHRSGAEKAGLSLEEQIQNLPLEMSGTPEPIDPFAMIARIESAQSHADLGRFCKVSWYQSHETDGHSSVVNIDNTYADPDSHRHSDSITGTVEFRQHVGTLDSEEIVSYIELLITAVRHCMNASDEDFLTLLVQGADARFNIRHLLCVLGFADDSIEFLCRDKAIGIPCALQDRHPINDQLPDLQSVNAEEECENHDPQTISDAVDEKMRGYYGWDPLAGYVPVTKQQIAMLLFKYRQIMTPSDARVNVLASIHRIYKQLDSSLSHEEETYARDPVVEELTGRQGIRIAKR